MELFLVFNALFLVLFFFFYKFFSLIFLGIDKVNQNLIVRVQVFFQFFHYPQKLALITPLSTKTKHT